MANRILVATLYQNSAESLYFLNISPDNITMNAGDDLYLVVEPGNASPSPGTYTFTLQYSGDGPFTSPPPSNSGTMKTPILLGTIASNYGNSYSYTLTVKYNSQSYTEDPKMKINPQG